MPTTPERRNKYRRSTPSHFLSTFVLTFSWREFQSHCCLHSFYTMRIASGSALFAACLVVASSANGKSENTSVTPSPQRDGRRVASLGSRKERELYGDLSIDSTTKNVEIRKVTPILDRLPSRLESGGLEFTSDRPQEHLEDFLQKSTGNLSIPLEDSCSWAAPASPSERPSTTQVRVPSDKPAFPSDLCLLEPSSDVHVHPPLYSGPSNSPLIGSEAFFLANPPLSRALAHCSTSLSIWCSENQKPTNLLDLPVASANSSTTHQNRALFNSHLTGETVLPPNVDQEGTYECHDGVNTSSVGTHIADGGWVSNLVQTLSS